VIGTAPMRPRAPAAQQEPQGACSKGRRCSDRDDAEHFDVDAGIAANLRYKGDLCSFDTVAARDNDTMQAIAQRHGRALSALIHANKLRLGGALTATAKLRAGTEVLLPNTAPKGEFFGRALEKREAQRGWTTSHPYCGNPVIDFGQDPSHGAVLGFRAPASWLVEFGDSRQTWGQDAVELGLQTEIAIRASMPEAQQRQQQQEREEEEGAGGQHALALGGGAGTSRAPQLGPCGRAPREADCAESGSPRADVTSVQSQLRRLLCQSGSGGEHPPVEAQVALVQTMLGECRVAERGQVGQVAGSGSGANDSTVAGGGQHNAGDALDSHGGEGRQGAPGVVEHAGHSTNLDLDYDTEPEGGAGGPASRTRTRELVSRTAGMAGEDDICVICQEALAKKRHVRTLACGHVSCAACLNRMHKRVASKDCRWWVAAGCAPVHPRRTRLMRTTWCRCSLCLPTCLARSHIAPRESQGGGTSRYPTSRRKTKTRTKSSRRNRIWTKRCVTCARTPSTIRTCSSATAVTSSGQWPALHP
jgi:hypothetical protein